jgi:hypothetical protein
MTSITRWKRSRSFSTRHVEGRGYRVLFLVAVDVNVIVVGAAVGQPVDQPRVGMEGEDDRFVLGEEIIEIHVA